MILCVVLSFPLLRLWIARLEEHNTRPNLSKVDSHPSDSRFAFSDHVDIIDDVELENRSRSTVDFGEPHVESESVGRPVSAASRQIV